MLKPSPLPPFAAGATGDQNSPRCLSAGSQPAEGLQQERLFSLGSATEDRPRHRRCVQNYLTHLKTLRGQMFDVATLNRVDYHVLNRRTTLQQFIRTAGRPRVGDRADRMSRVVMSSCLAAHDGRGFAPGGF